MSMSNVPNFVYRMAGYLDNGEARFQRNNRELTPFDVAPYDVECL